MNTAYIVVGLGYGDEGKGTIVDFLCRDKKAKLVIRHNGGAQAAHNVVTPDGKHHMFSQWGAGTLAGASTYLSKHMVVHPLAMLSEADKLKDCGITDPWSLLYVDERCLVTTMYHQALNRIREIVRGDGRHGSCGVGVGETMRYDRSGPGNMGLRVKDLRDFGRTRAILADIRRNLKITATHVARTPAVREELQWFDEMYLDAHARLLCDVAERWIIEKHLHIDTNIIFEGAQGILLDQNVGEHPYRTFSTTTSANAHEVLKEMGWAGNIETIGVTRAFATRHGAGPFRTEIEIEDPEDSLFADGEHNSYGQWQGKFRYGYLDGPMLKHALEIDGKIDYLAVTCLDRIDPLTWRMSTGVGNADYLEATKGMHGVAHVAGAISRYMNKAVRLISEGPTWKDKSWL